MATSTVNARPTDPNANSYVTVAEATAYFDDRLASDGWTSASDAEKAKALFEATRRVDRFRYFREKFRRNPEQALEFPRSDALHIGGSVDEVTSATEIIDETFANQEQYPDDFFNGWAIEMRGGSYQYQIRLVTDFVRATGAFTIETFGGVLTVNDDFHLIEKVPDLVKYAIFETALWLVNGGEEEGDIDPHVKQHSIGKFSETFVDGAGGEVKLPRKAYAYLQKFISRIGQITV